MTAFEKWKKRYDKYWATKDHIERLVDLGVLTANEYEEIVGEPLV